MPLEDSTSLFRSMDADRNNTISRNEFFSSSAGPVAKILELLVQAPSAHDQWQHLLKLLCIMEGRGRTISSAGCNLSTEHFLFKGVHAGRAARCACCRSLRRRPHRARRCVWHGAPVSSCHREASLQVRRLTPAPSLAM
jgi:hypothetical protein